MDLLKCDCEISKMSATFDLKYLKSEKLYFLYGRNSFPWRTDDHPGPGLEVDVVLVLQTPTEIIGYYNLYIFFLACIVACRPWKGDEAGTLNIRVSLG